MVGGGSGVSKLCTYVAVGSDGGGWCSKVDVRLLSIAVMMVVVSKL